MNSRKIFSALLAGTLLFLGTQNYAFAQNISFIKGLPGAYRIQITNSQWLDYDTQIDLKPAKNNGFELYTGFRLGRDSSVFGVNIMPGISAINFHSNANGWMVNDSSSRVIFGLDAFDNVKKQKLALAYVELPIELAFDFAPNDDHSFKLALGFKGGLLVSGKEKIKYRDEMDNRKKVKYDRTSELNPYRYGPTASIGIGSFAVSAFYDMANMFNNTNGPAYNYLTIGIGVMGF